MIEHPYIPPVPKRDDPKLYEWFIEIWKKLGKAGSLLGATRFVSIAVSELQTAPSTSSDTGTIGEIRVSADAIYVCVATNTWKKSTLSSF